MEISIKGTVEEVAEVLSVIETRPLDNSEIDGRLIAKEISYYLANHDNAILGQYLKSQREGD